MPMAWESRTAGGLVPLGVVRGNRSEEGEPEVREDHGC